jgi:predicted dinucleotide-binding enzyme
VQDRPQLIKKLNIGIMGTGNMGGALARALTKNTKHVITVKGSSRRSHSAENLSRSLNLIRASDAEFLMNDVLLVAVPARALARALTKVKSFSGVVISVSASESAGRDGKPSCAENTARSMPHASVVNAFSSIWSTVVRHGGRGKKVSVFIAGDEKSAKRIAAGLAKEIGFVPVDGGGLRNAIYGEVMGMFAVQLALTSGFGQRVSFQAFKA